MTSELKIEPNRRIGNYVLDEPIGRGAFAEVWKGHHHERPGRVVAVKIATHAEFRRQLAREGRLPDLDHPNVVAILDADTRFGDPPYIVMPFCPGGSLVDLIRKHPGGLPEDRVEQILRDVLSGLAAAHERGIVHGDVKPSNILLDGNGRALLTDFGLSHLTEAMAADASIQQSISLERGRDVLAGTLAYMAPEVRDGAPPTPASDVYCVGVVLFEMLTARRHQGIERPSHVRRGLSRGALWDQLFGRACAGLGARHASAQAMAAAFRVALAAPDGRPLHPNRPFPASAARKEAKGQEQEVRGDGLLDPVLERHLLASAPKAPSKREVVLGLVVMAMLLVLGFVLGILVSG